MRNGGRRWSGPQQHWATAVAVASWVMRNKRDYLWSAATRRRFFTTRHVTSFQSADMSAHPRAWTTRVAQKRKPEVDATLCSASAEVKNCGEAVRFPRWDANSSPTEGQPLFGHGVAFLFFRSRRSHDGLSPGRTESKRLANRFCRLRQNDRAARLRSRFIPVRLRPARSRGPAHAEPAYDVSARAHVRRFREKMH